MSPICELELVLSIQQRAVLWSTMRYSGAKSLSLLAHFSLDRKVSVSHFYSPSIDCRNTCVARSSRAAPREVPPCNPWSRPRPRSPPAVCPPLRGSPANRTTPEGPGCPREPRGGRSWGPDLLLQNISFRFLSFYI